MRRLSKSRHPSIRHVARLRPQLEVLENRLLLAADILVNDNAGSTGSAYFTQSETTLVAAGNSVIIGFNDSGSYNGANKFTGYSRSNDGGATFVDGGTLPTNNNGDAGDPVMARNDATGRIFFATLQLSGSGIDVFHSDDDGQTWTAPVQGAPGKSGLQDKDWLAVDNFPGAGNGNVYLMVRDFGPGNGIYFYRSTDNGLSFGPGGGTFIVSGNQGAYVAVGPDHAVYAFWFAGSSIQMRKSIDQGVTFGDPVTVVSGLVGGTNGDLFLTGLRQGTATYATFRSNEFPHAAVNPVTGNIYVTFANHGSGSDKADVFLVESTDGGQSFGSPTQVNDDATTTDQWFPTLAVTPDGSNLGIFYYSRQEDQVDNNLFKYYGRIANISAGTLTFQPGFAISDVASLPEFGRDSVVNSVYMGDYNQAVATPGAFHVVWSDNRADLGPPPAGNPNKDPNVYYEKILLGPVIIAATPTGNVPPPVDSYTVTFDRSMNTDPTNFTIDDVVITDPQGSTIPATSVTEVTGSGGTQFRIEFPAFDSIGQYTIQIGPGILDVNGKPMDEPFTGTIGITGPRVLSSVVDWNFKPRRQPAATKIEITFDRSMDPNTFTGEDVVFTNPQGNVIAATSVSEVAGSGGTVFEIIFPKQSAPKPKDEYRLVVGPAIVDSFNIEMDQNGNFIPGEPGDAYTVGFAKGGPIALHAEQVGHNASALVLAPAQAQQIVAEAIVRWQAVGADTSGLSSMNIQIGNLGGTLLGLADGNTIWLDDNAAGWGWFVDTTPGDNLEFVLPGNQGEQNRMDLLTVVMHELGHLLGFEHDEQGVMAESLAAGVRRTDVPHNHAEAVAQVFGQSSGFGAKAWLGAWLIEQLESNQPGAKRRR